MAKLVRERGEGVLKASTILIVALLTLADTAESFRQIRKSNTTLCLIWVLAVLARSINLGFSEHVVRAEAVNSVLALSAFNAGPLAAKAIGVIPRNRKTEVMIEKKNFLIKTSKGIKDCNL